MHKNTANEIIVDNIDNNETIHHSFLLLKITVHHADCADTSGERKVEVLVENGGESTRFEPTTLDQTHFKCLVELKLDENCIRLGYCCLHNSLNVKYLRRETNFEVVPLYIINEGHDGKFQAPETQDNTVESACARIFTGCRLLQCFISEKLASEGPTRKTFQIKSGCVPFKSKLRWEVALRMTPSELWANLGREIMQSGIGCESKKYFGFLACTRYNGSKYSDQVETHDEIVGLTEGYVALGGGGLALFGTACLYTWPEGVQEVAKRFGDCALVDKTRFMDDSCYRGTLGACFSTTLGSALHELCHTFDLGHTEDGIMGRGFDNISEFFVGSPSSLGQAKTRSALNNNNVIGNPVIFKACDGIYFTRSSAALLYYHRFFNNFPVKKVTLAFDCKSKLLKSTAGIRVIEIRDDVRETVIEHWVFPGRILRFSFRIPDSFKAGLVLVVEDNTGNVIKCGL